jgi:hypothetical protein
VSRGAGRFKSRPWEEGALRHAGATTRIVVLARKTGVGMILCHCTTTAPEAIEAEGLKPGQDSWKDWRDLLGPNTPEENVVWLTANCCVARRPTKWAYHLMIASRDRMLVSFEKLLSMARFPLEPDLVRQLSAWYIYFGTITPYRIVEILGAEEAAARRPKFWSQLNGEANR